eukprot:4382141-Lingulodinium_polyedra.AAC.1
MRLGGYEATFERTDVTRRSPGAGYKYWGPSSRAVASTCSRPPAVGSWGWPPRASCSSRRSTRTTAPSPAS